MITEFLRKYSPPGISLKAEKNFFIVGFIISFFYSFEFFAEFISERNQLFYYVGKNRVLNTQAVMPSFRSVLGNSLTGFIILGICMLGFIIYHYLYYRQGSMSIYLMKRLPKKSEMHLRAITLPVIAFLICLITALIVMLIYLAVYFIFTPKPCLAEGQWRFI